MSASRTPRCQARNRRRLRRSLRSIFPIAEGPTATRGHVGARDGHVAICGADVSRRAGDPVRLRAFGPAFSHGGMKVIGNYHENGYAHLEGLVPSEVTAAFMFALKQDVGPAPIPLSRVTGHPNLL